MRKKLCILAAIAVIVAAAGLPINISGAAAAKQRPVVTSEKQRFDPSQGLYFLDGKVYVAVSNRIITADQAAVDIAGMKVWAKGHVTLKQGDITFTGDSLYVNGRKNTAEISGHLYFVREGLAITAELAEFNWKTKIATMTGNVAVKQNGRETYHECLRYHVAENRFLP
jgi:lipopolysaccharide export system protein LptA